MSQSIRAKSRSALKHNTNTELQLSEKFLLFLRKDLNFQNSGRPSQILEKYDIYTALKNSDFKSIVNYLLENITIPSHIEKIRDYVNKASEIPQNLSVIVKKQDLLKNIKLQNDMANSRIQKLKERLRILQKNNQADQGKIIQSQNYQKNNDFISTLLKIYSLRNSNTLEKYSKFKEQIIQHNSQNHQASFDENKILLIGDILRKKIPNKQGSVIPKFDEKFLEDLFQHHQIRNMDKNEILEQISKIILSDSDQISKLSEQINSTEFKEELKQNQIQKKLEILKEEKMNEIESKHFETKQFCIQGSNSTQKFRDVWEKNIAILKKIDPSLDKIKISILISQEKSLLTFISDHLDDLSSQILSCDDGQNIKQIEQENAQQLLETKTKTLQKLNLLTKMKAVFMKYFERTLGFIQKNMFDILPKISNETTTLMTVSQSYLSALSQQIQHLSLQAFAKYLYLHGSGNEFEKILGEFPDLQKAQNDFQFATFFEERNWSRNFCGITNELCCPNYFANSVQIFERFEQIYFQEIIYMLNSKNMIGRSHVLHESKQLTKELHIFLNEFITNLLIMMEEQLNEIQMIKQDYPILTNLIQIFFEQPAQFQIPFKLNKETKMNISQYREKWKALLNP